MNAAGNIAPENLIVAAAHPIEPHSLEAMAEAPARSPALMAAALGLLALFTLADISSKGVIVSILYAVPLVVVARAGYASKLRWLTVGLVVIVFAAHFSKWALYSTSGNGPFNYNLVNRTFVVLALCLLEVLLKLRVSTEFLRGDVELSESLRHEEDETDETLAVLLGAGLTVMIALADCLAPANYNFAILYMVPLFLCAWTRSRRLLWGMLAGALVLTMLGFVCGPPAAADYPLMMHLIENRVLAGLVLTLLAVLLHFQIGDHTASRSPDRRCHSGNLT